MALLGAALTRKFGKGIVVSGFEHPSVQKPLERLAAMGYDVTVVAPARTVRWTLTRCCRMWTGTPSSWPA